MLIDTHCHLHDRDTYDFALARQNAQRKKSPLSPADFAPEKMLKRASDAGVKKIICVGTSHEDSLMARDFANAHDNVFWSYGIHPDEATANMNDALIMPLRDLREERRIAGAKADDASSSEWHLATTGASKRSEPRNDGREQASHEEEASIIGHSLVAIGEIGLDYRNGEGDRAAQLALLNRMLQLACDLGLPCIFHVRDAFPDFFAVIKNFPGIQGVVHSFSDDRENLEKSLDLGFYIGVNGLVTFAREIPLPPLEKILLETDAPFLTPEPFRGTINESAHVREICAFIAKVKGESEQEIARITTENAEQLFRL